MRSLLSPVVLLLLVSTAQCQKYGYVNMPSLRNGTWKTYAVAPKVSEHWARQKVEVAKKVDALKRCSRAARDAVLVQQVRANELPVVSAEQAYLTMAYAANFKADLERLQLYLQMAYIGDYTAGTRDPEFLRLIFVTLNNIECGQYFGVSIGTGLIKVFPEDEELLLAFLRSTHWS